MDEIHNKLGSSKEKTTALINIAIKLFKIKQGEKYKTKPPKETQNLSDFWGNVKQFNICAIGVVIEEIGGMEKNGLNHG